MRVVQRETRFVSGIPRDGAAEMRRHLDRNERTLFSKNARGDARHAIQYRHRLRRR